ncbi:MAG: hypothetical protein K2O18_17205 [Oscillospiraceae bacterium]|nr:hypothetical protein [Oscillospiraceae bacterium]
MNLKKTPYLILPTAEAREELRRRAINRTEALARSVARITSCDDPCPEYTEEVSNEYMVVDDLLFYQQCRVSLERCLENDSAILRYKCRDESVREVCFRRVSLGRVKIWGLPG